MSMTSAPRTELYPTDLIDDLEPVTITELATRLAALTAIAESHRERADNLALALDSNRQIGTAMGLIMARYGLNRPAAFRVLVNLSQGCNRKVRDLAEEIIMGEEATLEQATAGRSMAAIEPEPDAA